RVLRRPAGRLVPELWRDGLQATDQPLVALSTTQMVPTAGWSAAMRGRLEATGAAVGGGPIGPSKRNNLTNRALYLLRHVNYLPPLSTVRLLEAPGENAVYRRECLDQLASLWEAGFWEVEVHEAIRASGQQTLMADSAVVIHHGEGRFLDLIRERYRHAR